MRQSKGAKERQAKLLQGKELETMRSKFGTFAALTDEQRAEQIPYIQRTLAEVDPKTLAQWEDGFRRDQHPDQEIGLYMDICRAFESLVVEHAYTKGEKRRIYGFLISLTTGADPSASERGDLRQLAQHVADTYAKQGGRIYPMVMRRPL